MAQIKNHNGEEQEKVQLKLKQKWQIALRRYIIGNNPSAYYAPYFGLPAVNLKAWLELQFQEGMSWDNFGKKWNITQRIPPSLFDLNSESDLSLCWHFINITVQSMDEPPFETVQKTLTSKIFFDSTYAATGLPKCKEMIEKIAEMEVENLTSFKELQKFLLANKSLFQSLEGFDLDDFARLNKGEELEALIAEKEIIRKYGS